MNSFTNLMQHYSLSILPPNNSRRSRNESFKLIERRKSPAVLIRSAKMGEEATLVSTFTVGSSDCGTDTDSNTSSFHQPQDQVPQ